MYNPGRSVRLHSSARTSTGKVRENNEDNVLLWARDHFVLAIIADGMGGAVAGEEASRIAVETVHSNLIDQDEFKDNLLDSISPDILSDHLRQIIQNANAKIVQRAASNPELRGMGTTITLALVNNAYAVIGHVGDSRGYLVDGHDGSISQITSDHSFVEAMVAAGHISRSEAEDHPMRNVLYRALGQAEELDVDVYHSYLRAGDRLVLCSDGLTLHVKPEEIAEIVLSDHRPEVTSEKLINLANSRGGRDNVSVVVVNVENEPKEKPDDSPDNNHVAFNTEDDTIVLRDRRPFISSESDNSPQLESRDSTSNHLNDHLYLKDSRRSIVPDSVIEKTALEPVDTFGEGRDLLSPDQ